MSARAFEVRGASLGPGTRGSGTGGLGRGARRKTDEAMMLKYLRLPMLLKSGLPGNSNLKVEKVENWSGNAMDRGRAKDKKVSLSKGQSGLGLNTGETKGQYMFVGQQLHLLELLITLISYINHFYYRSKYSCLYTLVVAT